MSCMQMVPYVVLNVMKWNVFFIGCWVCLAVTPILVLMLSAFAFETLMEVCYSDGPMWDFGQLTVGKHFKLSVQHAENGWV